MDNYIYDEHKRTIVHIDLDCFYAQVEILKNPSLKAKPVGIQQKNLVVTSNYVAREYGVQKCMSVSEAQTLCPWLILVNGEDLKDYRQMSSKVSDVLRQFTPSVEKLGFDENFVDVTENVREYMDRNDEIPKIQDCHVYRDVRFPENSPCSCGCKERLSVGVKIATDMRRALYNELGLTSCAGISFNKTLAKLTTTTHKPNQQTVLFPQNVNQLLLSLHNVKDIPGIGQQTAERLLEIGIKTVEQLQNSNINKIIETLNNPTLARRLYDLGYGRDLDPVKPYGKPRTIGLMDSCKAIKIQTEVEKKFEELLLRLMELVSEDGRIPRCVKITLRLNGTEKVLQKQCLISPTLFTISNNTIILSQRSKDTLLKKLIGLFHNAFDTKKPYRITLMGIAFLQFQEVKKGCNSITSYLTKNISVQSITNLEGGECPSTSQLSSSFSGLVNVNDSKDKRKPFSIDSVPHTFRQEIKVAESVKDTSDGEPSPKRHKIDYYFTRKNTISEVQKLNTNVDSTLLKKDSSAFVSCPEGVDISVFKELPLDIQQELLNAGQYSGI